MGDVPWYLSASKRRRIAQWLAFILIVLLYPAFILLTMRDVWVVEFDLANRTRQTLEVTPMGQWDVTDTWSALPQPPESRRALRRPKDDPGTVTLAPGETATIRFDYDDISFTHLLIETPGGEVLLAPVTHLSEAGRLREEYVIETLEGLPEAPAELLPVLKGQDVQWSPASVETWW
jgi:hypothetical protein